jgi:hypothetical protein
MNSGTTDCTGTQNDGARRTIRSFTVHQDYEDRGSYDNNIALIELDTLVEYTDDIRPICLEPADYNDRVFLEMSGSIGRVIGKVAGCGATKHLFGFPPRLRVIIFDMNTKIQTMLIIFSYIGYLVCGKVL